MICVLCYNLTIFYPGMDRMQIAVPGYTIRPVAQTETDLASLLEVYRQSEDFLALGPVASASRQMVLADLDLSQRQGGVFYAIEEAATGVMAGVLDFVWAGFEGDAGMAYLSLLMIAAPYRGRGLGAAVVNAVEDAVRNEGRVRAIFAGVQVNNFGAQRFWQRMGFRIVSGPKQYPDGTVAVDLIKELT